MDTPKRGRGRPLSQKTIDTRAFDQAVKLTPPSAEMQAAAETVNSEMLNAFKLNLRSSRASWTIHNNPSPDHNDRQRQGRRERLLVVLGWLRRCEDAERRLSASALSIRWGKRDPAIQPRILAEYIRELRKVYGPNLK